MTFLVFASAAAEQPNLMANTDERRSLCTQFVESGLEIFDALNDDITVDQLVKVWETQTTDPNLIFLMTIMADLAQQYRDSSQRKIDYEIDMLHTCVTNAGTLDRAFLKLWLAKVPTDHPRYETNKWVASMTPEEIATINSEVEQSAAGENGLTSEDTKVLTAKDIRALLGDDFEGTHEVTAYTRRSGGEITGCGYEFSHVHYDHIYSMGAPVKISGSINVLRHPVQILAGLMKIKGETMQVVIDPDGTPRGQLSSFDIGDLYLSNAGQPIIADNQEMECEDAEYHCRINFEWDKFVDVLTEDQASFSYRRATGKSDVLLQIDWDQPEGAKEEVREFNMCMLELVSSASKALD